MLPLISGPRPARAPLDSDREPRSTVVLGWIAVFLIAMSASWMRASLFGTSEPRMDQASFSSHIRQMAEADHLWPKNSGQGFRRSLETDRKSLLFSVGEPIYNSPQFCFTLIPFLISSAVVSAVGYSYATIVGLSIAASALSVVAVAFVCMQCAKGSGKALLLGAISAFLYAVAVYPALYSPLGVHNFGVFMLLCSVGFATRFLGMAMEWGTMRTAVAVGLVSLLAGYSHFINPILLPGAIVLALATMTNITGKHRSWMIALYSVVIAAGFAPVLLASTILGKTNSSFIIYASIGSSPLDYIFGIGRGAVAWANAAMQTFSLPGAIVGIAGLSWMAVATPYRLPFSVLVCHFACYCLIPGFIWNGSHTWLRTFTYAIPFLVIGMSWMLGRAIWPVGDLKRLPALRAAIVAGVILHIGSQIPSKGYYLWANERVPEFALDYLDGQSELQPIVADIEAITNGAPLVFWDYGGRFVFSSLARGSFRLIPSTVATTLPKSWNTQSDRPQLPADTYLVARETEVGQSDVPATLRKAYGQDIEATVVRRWQPAVPVYGPFLLYRLQIK